MAESFVVVCVLWVGSAVVEWEVVGCGGNMERLEV